MSEIIPKLENLSPKKRELVLKRLQKQKLIAAADQRNQTLPIVPVSREWEIPLSFAQARLWFLDQLEGESATYNMPTALRLVGSLQIAALEMAVQEIVRRHEVLRTTFEMVNGSPKQLIDPTLTITLPVIDLQLLPEVEQSVEVERLATEEAQRPFNLTNGNLLRVTLLHLGDEEHVLLATMHHIVSDGWSIGIFIRELSILYKAFCTGAPSPLLELPIQYADFAVWQRQWLSGEVLESQLNYWRQQLAGAPPVLKLPTDRPRPLIQRFWGSTEEFQLNRELTERLKTLSQQSEATLFMTLLAIFVTLLSRYSGQEDIVIGTPIANRNRSEIESLIGFFVNTLVLRTNLKENPSFEELLQRVRRVALDAYDHQDVPFEQLVEALQPTRSVSHPPLFQVIFILQNAPIGKLELPGLTLTPLEISNVAAKFDLTLSLTETPQGLMGALEYNCDLFDRATITRMLGHFQTLLEQIVANPQQRVSDLLLLTPAEQHQLLVEWNQTQTKYPQSDYIHQLFEEQVLRTPEAVAVLFEDQQLTYRELNARANKIAHYLQALGVRPEVLVGIYVERSLLMVVGLLAILKAGGAYVPLDPAYPQERLAFMLSDAQVAVLLTQDKLLTRLPEHRAHVLCLDKDWRRISRESEHNPICGAQPTSLAYVLYTSGSTGRPKGVAIEHHSPVALLNWTREAFTTEQLSGILASTSICFDLSVFELFAPLSWGGKAIIAESALYLPTLPAALNVTLINTVPSAIAELVRVNGVPASVHTVTLAGETLHSSLVQQLYQQDTIEQVFNLYGPSEATTYSTFTFVNRGTHESPTIGRPITNEQTYILDYHLQQVPVGVPGELYIGGVGLARGYLNRPELTLEKFIPNPFSNEPGARLYKTGDLARYLPDGNIDFLGRIDHQAKIRGFRIELGEVEMVLNQHPQVRETVVIAWENQPGNKRLVAYVVPHREQVPATSELRHFLKQKLPEYMLPSAFVILDALPLTPNGKIDRQALPAPDLSQRSLEAGLVPPRTPTQEVVAAIWADILGVEVGIHNNFFESGGHSLLATQIISRLREAFCVELSLRRLFEYPTIAELSESIEAARRHHQGQMLPPIQHVSRAQELPLSFAQSRLWFLDQLEGGSAIYNMPAAVRLVGSLHITALEQALAEIVRRHEVLRTAFELGNGSPIQVIASTLNVTVPIVDLQALLEEEQSTQIQHLAIQEAEQPFDLSNSPLLRVTLLRLAPETHVLLLTVHHIVSDGWSMGIFIREIGALYEAFCKGVPSPLPELPVQYADFAVWQRQWLSGEVLETQLNYWQQQLAGAPPLLELPTDYPRPPVQTFLGSSESFELNQDLTQKLKTLSQQSGATLFMTLLAAFATLLSRYTGQEDIVVGSPIANRNRAELEGLIGFFANTLALRIDVSGELSFRTLLGRVREVTMGAYAHQDLPFEKLVEVLQPERVLSHNPLVQVAFALQNAPMGSLVLPGLNLSQLEFDSGTVKLDLEFHLWEVSQSLRGSVQYSTDLFEAATIARMVGHFQTLLKEIVANPDQQLVEMSLLTVAEQQQLLVMSNGLEADAYGGQMAKLAQLSDQEVNALLNEILNEGKGKK